MILFVLRRLGAALVVAWLAMTLAFIALRWVPGDALDETMALSGAPEEDIALRREALGLNDPIWQQYLAYLLDLVRGDMGESLVSGQRVGPTIRQNLDPTVTLASGALLVGATLGITLGTWQARSLARRAFRGRGSGIAGTVHAGLLDGDTGDLRLYYTVGHSARRRGPGHSLSDFARVRARFSHGGQYCPGHRQQHPRGRRAGFCADSARQRSAGPGRARPHSARRSAASRGGGGAPVRFSAGRTVITETIFVRRGLGRVMLAAIQHRDYPVIQGLVVLAALVYSLINALADILYGLVDPRVDFNGRE
jgi:peptide/nickel transport system permease protein